MKKEPLKQTIILDNGSTTIPEGTLLPKLGAGVDGEVYRYQDKALKVLKGDISERKVKGLMTFEKVLYFKDNLRLHRITSPIDIFFDENGVYAGYIMDYINDITLDERNPLYRKPSEFSCGDLLEALKQLEEDFESLSRKKVKAVDINFGSYIFAEDFIHLCDMDKYQIADYRVDRYNQDTLAYVIAKFIAREMRRNEDNSSKAPIQRYVKQSVHNSHYFESIKKDIGSDIDAPLSEYIESTKQKILTI